jgi:hypothetical protein
MKVQRCVISVIVGAVCEDGGEDKGEAGFSYVNHREPTMIQKYNCGRLVGSLIFGVTVLTVALVCPAFAQESRTKIGISYPNVSIANLALFAAQQWRTFEQNGLEVESIQMRSQAANAALASGDVHYVAGVGPNSVAATLRVCRRRPSGSPPNSSSIPSSRGRKSNH